MAASATDMGAPPRAGWLELLRPSPARWEFALRLALICALTTLVTQIYQTPDPALTAYVAFFINRPGRTPSLIMSVALTVVVSIVIAIVFLVAQGVADDPMWRVASIATISFGLLFLASASKLRPIAATLALIIGYALDLLGTIQLGEEATRALLYAWLFVAIPAAVSFLVNLALGPPPRRAASRAIAALLRTSAAFLRSPADDESRDRLRASAREGVAEIREQLRFAGLERSAVPSDLGALNQTALSTGAFLDTLEVLAANPEIHLPRASRVTIADTLDAMAEILQRDAYPTEITLELPEIPGEPLAARLLNELRTILTHFAVPSAVAQPAKEKSGGFLVTDAFSNPEHVRYALKTTSAAVFCYCLYSLLDWPGIHTCFLTCYIVAQASAAESVEKLTLRIVGCLLGAAGGIATIVYLVPSLTSIGGLIAAVFAGAWIAAYVAAGSARISYAGFQIAFAFFLCVSQGSGPALDLTVARDRIIGILLGNLVAYVAMVHIWPVTVSRRVNPGLAAGLRVLRDLALAEDRVERQRLASEERVKLGSLETDIDLARYEPASIRAPDSWLATRRAAAEDSRMLGGLLLLASQPDDISRPAVAARLESLAARLDAHGTDDERLERASPPAADAPSLASLIEQRLQHLEGLSVRETPFFEDDGHARA